MMFSADEGAGVGLDDASPVSTDYKEHDNSFTGKIIKVVIDVKATTARGKVLGNGQLATVSGTVDILAHFPARLRIESVSGQKERLYLYDGKSVTLYGKAVKYYATVPAPPSIKELADVLADKYYIELPLQDLFWWGTERVNSSVITAAVDVGPAEVEGISCEQYAFRQEGVDWQIWIQQGEYPLPLKLVITTTTDVARPRFTAVYSWNLAPSFNEAAFTFTPPSDAKRIALSTLPGKGN